MLSFIEVFLRQAGLTRKGDIKAKPSGSIFLFILFPKGNRRLLATLTQ